MEILPDDLLWTILSHIPGPTFTLSQVSKKWYKLYVTKILTLDFGVLFPIFQSYILRNLPGVRVYEHEEVIRHVSKNDCWVTFGGHIFDVSGFLDKHPGGADILLECAGKDCSSLFFDMGHSEDAYKIMLNYRIGRLSDYDPESLSKKILGSVLLLKPEVLLKFIRQYKNLKTLVISKQFQNLSDSDLYELQYLTNLHNLSILCNTTTTWAFLPTLPKTLSSLTLAHFPIHAWPLLASLTHLTHLDLSEPVQPVFKKRKTTLESDVHSTLVKLSNLVSLKLTSDFAEGYPDLAEFTQMKSLTLEDTFPWKTSPDNSPERIPRNIINLILPVKRLDLVAQMNWAHLSKLTDLTFVCFEKTNDCTAPNLAILLNMAKSQNINFKTEVRTGESHQSFK